MEEVQQIVLSWWMCPRRWSALFLLSLCCRSNSCLPHIVQASSVQAHTRTSHVHAGGTGAAAPELHSRCSRTCCIFVRLTIASLRQFVFLCPCMCETNSVRVCVLPVGSTTFRCWLKPFISACETIFYFSDPVFHLSRSYMWRTTEVVGGGAAIGALFMHTSTQCSFTWLDCRIRHVWQ